MRVLLPKASGDVSVDEVAELYRYGPARTVRANMVSSLDGAVAVEGRSKPISGAADLFLFGLLRALADVVLVGAGTARTEGYGPGRARKEFAHLRNAMNQQPAPTIAMVTRSANLDPAAAIFTEAANRTIVITCECAPKERKDALTRVAEVITCGDGEVDLHAAMDELAKREFSRVLCEGGPTLLGSMAAANLVDELAWSISPTIAGGTASRIINTDHVLLQAMTPKVLMEQDGYFFSLYSRAPEQQPEGESS